MFEFENQYRAQGCQLIAGCDEAGRGSLAGPVSCATVIMPLNDVIDGVNDSKKLSAKKRDTLCGKILEKAIAYHVVLIDNLVIDEINILNATKRGMAEAIAGLSTMPDIVLIDAVPLHLDVKSHSIIKGDAKSYQIAAASILAKVTRDRFMEEQAKLYPKYGFEKHKGYGTKLHYEMIERHGICPIHRRSFLTRINYHAYE